MQHSPADGSGALRRRLEDVRHRRVQHVRHGEAGCLAARDQRPQVRRAEPGEERLVHRRLDCQEGTELVKKGRQAPFDRRCNTAPMHRAQHRLARAVGEDAGEAPQAPDDGATAERIVKQRRERCVDSVGRRRAIAKGTTEPLRRRSRRRGGLGEVVQLRQRAHRRGPALRRLVLSGIRHVPGEHERELEPQPVGGHADTVRVQHVEHALGQRVGAASCSDREAVLVRLARRQWRRRQRVAPERGVLQARGARQLCRVLGIPSLGEGDGVVLVGRLLLQPVGHPSGVAQRLSAVRGGDVVLLRDQAGNGALEQLSLGA